MQVSYQSIFLGAAGRISEPSTPDKCLLLVFSNDLLSGEDNPTVLRRDAMEWDGMCPK